MRGPSVTTQGDGDCCLVTSKGGFMNIKAANKESFSRRPVSPNSELLLRISLVFVYEGFDGGGSFYQQE